MTGIQDTGAEPQEPIEEVELETEEFPDESEGRSTVMPWLLPILVIVAFFAFVALLVYFLA